MQCLTVIALAFLALASAKPATETEHKIADKEFLVRQRQLLVLFERVLQQTRRDDILQKGKDYVIENHLDKYEDVETVKKFVDMQKMGMLPMGDIFSIMNERQRKQAIALVRVLLHAKDWETFYSTACWARMHVNAGIFTYAMNVAVLRHKDTRGMVLPAPYEIYPYFFVTSDVIQKAYFMQMRKTVDGLKLHEHHGLKTDENVITIDANYTGTHMQMNRESMLSYFTEDVGLNAFYYYVHVHFPFWMEGLDDDKRGEIFAHLHQQLLARYHMERLSNGMGSIDRFDWWKTIRAGYNPSIMYPTGIQMPYRPNSYDMRTEYKLDDLIEVEDLERRIREAVSSGVVIMPDGTEKMLKKPEDINMLGKLIETTEEFKHSRYYRYVWMVGRSLLGGHLKSHNDDKIAPSALDHFETSLRDPMFWQLYKRLTRQLMVFNNQLPTYTKEELLFPGVKIENVMVDKLVTFFDYFKMEITNAIFMNDEEITKKTDKLIILARQMRLNHQPFTIKMEVKSDKEVDALVKIFIGPKRDVMGNLCELDMNRLNFLQIDSSVHKLKAGMNKIERDSTEFLHSAPDSMPSRTLIKKIDAALEGREEFIVDDLSKTLGFPNRLGLPKGTKGGMMFQLYVIVSPLRIPKTASTRVMRLDSRTLGFPLDRRIDMGDFMTPNMHMMDVPIFHKTEIEPNMAFKTMTTEPKYDL